MNSPYNSSGPFAPMYNDRSDAGRILAVSIAALPNIRDAVVLGLPRGGVPVAYEVAHACGLPLDVLVVRKLGAPGQRELAMGAIASGGAAVYNPDVVRALGISSPTLAAILAREQHHLEEMERAFRAGLPPVPIDGRTVILVDDGLATGASMRAAARSVRPRARRLILAAPVGAASTVRDLAQEADEIICPLVPEPLDAVGQFYADFAQTSDEEVHMLLVRARHEHHDPDLPVEPDTPVE